MDVATVGIFADNQGAIKLVKNPVVSNRSKHIDVVYHFARERVARKDVKIAYVKTNDMLADMLTKPVEKAKLDLCNRGIGHGLEATHASIDRPSGSVVVHDMRPRR